MAAAWIRPRVCQPFRDYLFPKKTDALTAPV
jgi:hypothetical protein